MESTRPEIQSPTHRAGQTERLQSQPTGAIGQVDDARPNAPKNHDSTLSDHAAHSFAAHGPDKFNMEEKVQHDQEVGSNCDRAHSIGNDSISPIIRAADHEHSTDTRSMSTANAFSAPNAHHLHPHQHV